MGALLGVWLACAMLAACGEFTPIEHNTIPSCGTVRATAGSVLPQNAAAATNAENCFADNYATHCSPVMSLTYIDVSGNTTTTQTFQEGRGRSNTCEVDDNVQLPPATGGGTPTPIQENACTGLQQQADGLLFTSCGQQGDVLVPAPPAATATTSTAYKPYPHLAPTAKSTPFIVVGCKLSDVSTVPSGLLDTATRFLTSSGSGLGNMLDYYSDVSYGAISLTGSRVVGWYNTSLTLSSLKKPDQRLEAARECAEAVPPGVVDFSKYYALIALVDAPTDDEGACAIGPTAMAIHGHTYSLGCDVFDPDGLFTGFAAHEMGHALGLQHSWDNNKQYCSKTGHFNIPPAPGEYCDPWDVMSALNSYRFDGGQFPTVARKSNPDGPGLNVPNLIHLGWLPSNRVAHYAVGDHATTYALAALSHPTAKGDLAIRIDTVPLSQASTSYFTVEYRQQDGWDAGIPANTVLIHEYQEAGRVWSYLQRTPPPNATVVPGEWLTGMTWVAPDNSHIQVRVVAIDPAAGTATVTIGPEGAS